MGIIHGRVCDIKPTRKRGVTKKGVFTMQESVIDYMAVSNKKFGQGGVPNGLP